MIFIIVEDGCIIIIHEIVTCDSSSWKVTVDFILKVL